MRLRALATKVTSDLQNGAHREAYALLTIGLGLAALGVLGVASEKIVLSGVLVACTYLIFQAKVGSSPDVALETVLRDRSSFKQLSSVIIAADTIWVCGPSAVNIVINAADIRRHILEKGGEVRILVQDPESASIPNTMAQLDDSLDFRSTLENSIRALGRMRRWGDLTYRLMEFSPGFSLLVVNPRGRDPYIVVEFHGFADDNIVDRMHVLIRRSESVRWYDYWLTRFEKLWEAANDPR